MKTTLDCIPCIIRQALDAARFVTDDVVAHERILRDVLRETAEIDLSQSPPVVGQKMHRQLRQLSGIADPYRKAKDQFNKLALEMVSELEADIAKSAEPLYLALRLAIAGNVIDLGVKGGIGDGEVRKAIRNTLNEPFHGDIEDFRLATGQAQSILYLADNAGEIVFDRLLIEQLLPARVTVAERRGKVLNDAVREDEEADGLCRRESSTRSDAPGTVLEIAASPPRHSTRDLIHRQRAGQFRDPQRIGSQYLLSAQGQVPRDCRARRLAGGNACRHASWITISRRKREPIAPGRNNLKDKGE